MRRTARPWPIVFTVEGLNIERFVRRAGEQGIRLTGIRRVGPKRLTALVPEDSMPALREIALNGGWKLTAGSRQGTGRAADWLHRRWLLAAAICMAGIALFAASQVMWRVEVVDGGSYAADIQSALAELGIEAPALRQTVDIGALRETLEWRYPRIAWFECGWRGTTLVVRPVEGVLPRADTEPDGSCDVAASRDGIVKIIVTRAGTPVVSAGDFVRKGDVLIRGEERTSEGAVRPVAARGNVMARVWTGSTITMPIRETITTYTGCEEMVWTIRTPWFNLWPMQDSAYNAYDTSVTEMPFGGFLLPLTLHVETRMEAQHSVQMRDIDEVKADAYAAAVRKLHEKINETESLIDIWGNCSIIDDEKVQSVAIGEMLVEIGVQVPSSGMAAPEQAAPE